MHHDKHWLGVVGSNILQLFVGVIDSPSTQCRVLLLERLNNKIYGKGAPVGLVVGFKDLALVPDLGSGRLGGRPHGLQMAIEK